MALLRRIWRAIKPALPRSLALAPWRLRAALTEFPARHAVRKERWRGAWLRAAARLRTRLGGARDIWIFTAWGGRICGDNPRHLFEHVRATCPDVRAVWILDNAEQVERIRRRGWAAFTPDGRDGRAWISLASACFYSDLPLFGPALSSTTLKVNLWHGMPMKNIDEVGAQVDDLAIATSPESQQILARAFRHPLEKVVVTGQPKNDVLFRPGIRPAALAAFGPGCRIVTYMPTYRGDFNNTPEHARSNRSGILLGECLGGPRQAQLAEVLERHNAVLAIKPHLRNRPPAVDLARVVVVDEYDERGDALDSHELMAVSDVFITDYSSVYFDFLLTGRPLILFAPDYESYRREQNLYYDLRELAAGAFAATESELIALIDRSLSEPDWNRPARTALNQRFNTHQDGQSCARVVALARTALARRTAAAGRGF